MAISDSEIIGVSAERLLSSAIMLHEASSHGEMTPEIPYYLRAALKSPGVVMVLIGLTARGTELARATFSSGQEQRTDVPKPGDWVSQLLAERLQRRPVENCRRAMMRSAGDDRLQIFCELGVEHAVAFDIQSPAAFDVTSEQGRAWLLALLENVARNMSLQLNRPSPAASLIPPLSGLTAGEWRILLAIDSDESEKEIASRLALSTHTIHSHIKNVYRVLKARSRLEAISILHHAERLALLQTLLPLDMARENRTIYTDGFSMPRRTDRAWAPILERQREIAAPAPAPIQYLPRVESERPPQRTKGK